MCKVTLSGTNMWMGTSPRSCHSFHTTQMMVCSAQARLPPCRTSAEHVHHSIATASSCEVHLLEQVSPDIERHAKQHYEKMR